MIQGDAILVVDLGNSSTKVKVLFGKNSETGRYNYRKLDIPNVFALVDEDYEVSGEYNEATSTILRVDTEFNGRVIKGDFCNGELQEKEKPLCTIKPSATAKKYTLDSTVLSYRLAFLHAFKAIMQMNRVTDYTQLDINWKVVTLLPPGDLDVGRELITNIIQSITSVQGVFPEMNLPVKIKSIHVLPEGYCAYVGVVYDAGHVFRPSHQFLINERVLVIDIGAGTTDILLISGNKLVQNSKYTITQGGNNVYQLVRRSLRVKGLDINEEEIRQGIIKGYIKDGSQTVPIADIVNNAKAEIAQKLISEIYDFLELTDIKARSVGYLLICGGGSMQDSECKEILPLSEKVIEAYKNMSPNTSIVDIPTQAVTVDDEFGEPKKIEAKISPRELNLLGASIMAEIL